MPLLAVRDLAVSFAARDARPDGSGLRTQAVAGVSMTLYPAQTLAVVGESGCGKSVTALSLMRLLPRPAARIDRGTALFKTGTNERPIDLYALPDSDLRRIRGGQIAMIFQEPMTSLNPVLSVGEQIIEAIRLHRPHNARQSRGIAADALRTVGIADPSRGLAAYPHEFSGGMRQRVMIAMALACQPRLLLADEPTTALDATIQQQILDLLGEIRSATQMAVMLITHDLGVVRDRADVVCVMYAGRVVEYARAELLLRDPLHPYTRALLSCVPSLGTRDRRLTTIAEMAKDPSFMRMPRMAGTTTGVSPAPWWPPALGDSTPPYSLIEVAPEHWVALATTDRSPSAPPDLAPPQMQTV